MSLSSKPPGLSRHTRQMQRSIMSSESRLVESAGQASKALSPVPLGAWGPSAQPHMPQADAHRHPDLEPVLTPPLSQWVFWEASQTVLSFWTKPRAPLSLRVPLAVASAASRRVVSGPACQGERRWGRAFSVGIRLRQGRSTTCTPAHGRVCSS